MSASWMPNSGLRKSLALQAKTYHHNLRTSGQAQDYLSSRGITMSTAVKFQLGWTGEHENRSIANRLAIPYLAGPAGPWHIKYRSMDDQGPKYIYEEGVSLHLFNTQTLLHSSSVVICEGELDAITIEQVGVPAVGYPGAQAWKANDHWPAVFDSCERVVVVADGDPVGREAADGVAASLRKELPDLQVTRVVLPDGQDSNSLIQQQGAVEYLSTIGWI